MKPLKVTQNAKTVFGRSAPKNIMTGKNLSLIQEKAEGPPGSVTTLGGTSEGGASDRDENALENALDDFWTAGGATGLMLYCTSRVVYNETGDKKLYAYVRKMTFDKTGKLYQVSEETRVEVDEAVAS